MSQSHVSTKRKALCMPDEATLPARIERRLELSGYQLHIEDDRDALVLTGVVTTEGERQAVLDTVREMAPDVRLRDNITVASVLPGEMLEGSLSGVEVAGFEGAEAGLSEPESMMPGDFTDQHRVRSAHSIQPGSSSGGGRALTSDDQAVTEGDAVYTPPIDPVGTNTEVIGGFSASSMESIEVARSSDGTLGDEAIADAIRRELREDAATTAFDLEVEVRRGVVSLRGRVWDVADVENVEEVASRVPGVVEVSEELTTDGMKRDRIARDRREREGGR